MARALRYGRLRSFLGHADRPAGTLGYHEVQGFFFALLSCPDLVMPSEWMPVIFGDKSAGYADLEEAQAILSELMALYNEIGAGILLPPVKLPGDCRFRRDVRANLESDAPVSQWCRGFVMGHQWLEESWDGLPSDLEAELSGSLVVLSFFATPGLAKAFAREVGRSDDVDGMVGTCRRLFRGAMTSYAVLGRSIAQAVRDVEERQASPTSAPRVGRGKGRKGSKKRVH